MPDSISKTLCLRHATAVTLSDESGYGLIEDACLVCCDGIITYIGADNDRPLSADLADHLIDCHGALLTPALIDCHTHLVFDGNRAGEFEQRLKGVSYEDIAKAGGGIASTVRATRLADESTLLAATLPRAQALIRDGVATLEIKSGYGLETESELRMLRVARLLGEQLGITVKTTFLAAHALPPEFAQRADDYITHICQTILPTAVDEGLVDAVDAFCEHIAFSPEQVERVFDIAHQLGIRVKLHADQLSDLNGAALSARYNGLSADHVEYTNEASVAAMAAHNTTAVLLPGAYFCLRETQLPPIDAFRQHGVPMAISTDANPGTSPLLSLRLAMSMACTQFRLTPEEALRGATCHAAKALGLSDRGRLNVGMRADLALWQVNHPAELSYWLGGNLLSKLIINGKLHD